MTEEKKVGFKKIIVISRLTPNDILTIFDVYIINSIYMSKSRITNVKNRNT